MPKRKVDINVEEVKDLPDLNAELRTWIKKIDS